MSSTVSDEEDAKFKLNVLSEKSRSAKMSSLRLSSSASVVAADAVVVLRTSTRSLLDAIRRATADSPTVVRAKAAAARVAKAMATRFRPLLLELSQNSLLAWSVGTVLGLVMGRILFRRRRCPMKPRVMRGVVWDAKKADGSTPEAVVSFLNAVSEWEAVTAGLTVRHDLPAPRVVSDDEVLVRVTAASIDAADLRILQEQYDRTRRRGRKEVCSDRVLLGRDLVGVVEEVGTAVNRLSAGDKVWSARTSAQSGSLCDYVVLKSGETFPCPVGVEDTGAATVPYSGLLALDCLKRRCSLVSEAGGDDDDDGLVKPPPRSVLVLDATSASGALALQMLHSRCRGVRVTAATPFRAISLAKLLGAFTVLDMRHLQEEMHQKSSLPFGDVIMAGTASHEVSDEALKGLVLPGGRVETMSEGGPPSSLVTRLLRAVTSLVWSGGKRMVLSDLEVLREMIECGELKPVRDQTFPLERVAEAVKHVAGPEGAVGKTAIVLRNL